MTSSEHPFGETLDEMDVTTFFNMRDWLQKACELQGAKTVGGGIGCGQADIDIELEGHWFNVSIRPLKKPEPTELAGEQIPENVVQLPQPANCNR